MDATTAQRFPLIARPRPACIPLADRMTSLHALAASSIATGNLADATYVFNQAALLASDCGDHDLARRWCHRLARLALTGRHPGRFALEPVVNLARLRIRVGDGTTAWEMLEALYQAITNRATITIDGLIIATADLTHTGESHRELRQWAWKVLLGTGAHALASAHRWDEAGERLTHHRGIGQRMLDGRQIAVIAHTLAGRTTEATTLLHDTTPGQPWENAVTDCLYLLCTAIDHNAAYTTYYQQPPGEGLAVFWTRLGLSLIDALGHHEPQAKALVTRVLHHATDDGYAARDALAHQACREAATDNQVHQLRRVVRACGLDQGFLNPDYTDQLTTLFSQVEPLIRWSTPAAR
ncbi:hypothetical protein Q0Z83_089700 [Actinoplanes sichuanensis]|uniref:Transcriptional regulator n=1 Tax=Actinoplanes sichuanensis TaxID=512349 RepID=A0ABW4AJW4_9ACTN|nr:hypothetical protein [Actinoplanes sichuanensis]BEL10779.1 hypothetical protein Q0Z83_089700 [Actinoplanes sichuanensis]